MMMVFAVCLQGSSKGKAGSRDRHATSSPDVPDSPLNSSVSSKDIAGRSKSPSTASSCSDASTAPAHDKDKSKVRVTSGSTKQEAEKSTGPGPRDPMRLCWRVHQGGEHETPHCVEMTVE